MPEEINRITCDHCSTLLFSPTMAGVENLAREGFPIEAAPPYSPDHPGVFHCGDVMYDNACYFSTLADEKSDIIQRLALDHGKFVLATIHRDNNTDNAERLQAIFSALLKISDAQEEKIILPLHPRTLKMLDSQLGEKLLQELKASNQLIISPPVSFLEMIMLEKHASLIITDSGGVQKESYFHHKACIILRPETEWVEIVENGSAIIVDADEEKILAAYKYFKENPPVSFPPLYGDGKAAWFICNKLLAGS